MACHYIYSYIIILYHCGFIAIATVLSFNVATIHIGTNDRFECNGIL